jgi:long-chain acyl-CoA synthetase
MLNLSMFLDDGARKYPQREAVISGPQRLTYGRLNELACQVANGLRARGLNEGDRVALSCPNLAYFPIVYYGILKAGGVVVPLNVLFKSTEIAYHLQDSQARFYFCFEGTPELPMAQAGHEGFKQAPECEQFYVMTVDPAASSPIPETETLSQFVAGQAEEFVSVYRKPDDTAVILYTSGTTGRPKGAELTHANMLINTFVSKDLTAKVLGPEEPKIILVALPLFHSFGQTVQMNGGILSGGTLVLVPRFEPGPVLELFQREKIRLFSGVPTMYWAMLNHVRENGLNAPEIGSTLRVCNSGGAAMPVELLKAFEEAFNVTILEGYGLSETSPVATFNQADLPRKVGSIGLPVFGTELRIVDADGNDVPAGEAGEIVIRGHNVMKGYWNRPEATAESIRNGWFHTGDMAKMDEDGYIFIVDRLKDLIIRGGFNVYPREIEELLATHPAVSLVAVVGVPHLQLGEEIKAFIVLKPGEQVTEEEIIAWCKERLAAYKYPRIVEFRETLPMSATGKLLKRELRSEEAARPADPPATARA